MRGPGVVTCPVTHVYPDSPGSLTTAYAGGRWGSLDAQWDESRLPCPRRSAPVAKYHHPTAVGRDHRAGMTGSVDPFAAALRVPAKSRPGSAGVARSSAEPNPQQLGQAGQLTRGRPCGSPA